jgi:hypothetical protein
VSLRRTGISRKSELRRTPFKARSRELRAKQVRKIARPRDTGPTPAQRALVAERAGWCCELCGHQLHDGDSWMGPHSWHHRQPRGMGSSRRPETNAAYNLLLVCGTGNDSGCHGFIESHRKSAEDAGWLVRHGLDPAEVPVAIHGRPGMTLLTDDGDYRETRTNSTKESHR